VHATTKEEAIELLEIVDEFENLVTIYPYDIVPEWIPVNLRDSILTPSEAKGLEYQSVIVLNPGKFLAELNDGNLDMQFRKLDEQAYRIIIDQLRVSLSRATETLVFLDVEANENEIEESLAVLEMPAPFDSEDLIEHFTDRDITPEERVTARLREARSLIDEKPNRSWRRAVQALRLLGDPKLPNGVASESVRRDTYMTLLYICCRLLIDRIPEGIAKRHIISTAEEVVNRLGNNKYKKTLDRLILWTEDKSQEAITLINSILELENDDSWIKESLVSISQQLRKNIEQYSTLPQTAIYYTANVEQWLRVINFMGDIENDARKLRVNAFNALLSVNDIESAQEIHEYIQPVDLMCEGKLMEFKGEFEEAAENFEKAGAFQDAFRNWRLSGNWEKAIDLINLLEDIDDDAKSDLLWLSEFANVIQRRPENFYNRITEKERERLVNLIDRLKPGKTLYKAG
jgi:tetratricopeptide (TPR) repeat protein